MLNEMKETIWIIAVGLMLGGLWYCFWVHPNDQVMTEIMECMDGDQSREAYNSCRNLVVNNGRTNQ